MTQSPVQQQPVAIIGTAQPANNGGLRAMLSDISVLEVTVGIIIAAFSAIAAIQRSNMNRLQDIDRRVDSVELEMAKNYASKADLLDSVDRILSRMTRIEDKIDELRPCRTVLNGPEKS